MWRHSCFATVHDCPYWQLFSGAWHFAQCRKNRSHLPHEQSNHEEIRLIEIVRSFNRASSMPSNAHNAVQPRVSSLTARRQTPLLLGNVLPLLCQLGGGVIGAAGRGAWTRAARAVACYRVSQVRTMQCSRHAVRHSQQSLDSV